MTTSVQTTTPPTTPSTDFLGEMWARNRRRPNERPTRNAPVSNDQTPSTSSRIHARSGPSGAAGASAGRSGATDPTRTTNASRPAYRAPKVVAIHAASPSRGSGRENAPTAMRIADTARSSSPLVANGAPRVGAAASTTTATAATMPSTGRTGYPAARSSRKTSVAPSATITPMSSAIQGLPRTNATTSGGTMIAVPMARSRSTAASGGRRGAVGGQRSALGTRCQRPKRRLRPANSSSAASKASGPKSGQSALEV